MSAVLPKGTFPIFPSAKFMVRLLQLNSVSLKISGHEQEVTQWPPVQFPRKPLFPSYVWASAEFS